MGQHSHLYNLRSTSCLAAANQISSQSAYWFRRRSHFLDFHQNAPLRGPKKGQRPHLYNLRSTSCPRCSTPNFSSIRTSGSGEEDFFRFSQNAPLRGPKKGQRPHLYNLRSTSCPNAPHQISAQSDQWFGRRSRKCEKSNGRRTDAGRRTTRDDISSPGPKGPGELIEVIFSFFYKMSPWGAPKICNSLFTSSNEWWKTKIL